MRVKWPVILCVRIVMVGGSTTFAEAWAPRPPPPRRRVSLLEGGPI